MKYLIILILSTICIQAKSKEYTFNKVKYLRNYDGDTITVEIKEVHPMLGDNMPIRIKGIDTPEIKGKTECEKEKAKEAKEFVKIALQNAKKIDLTESSRGKYFRIVAFVIYDGKNLSDELVKAGLTVPYDGGTKTKVDWCKK